MKDEKYDIRIRFNKFGLRSAKFKYNLIRSVIFELDLINYVW